MNYYNLIEMGYKIKFLRKISGEIYDTDILILLSKPAIQILNERQSVFEVNGPAISFVKKAKQKVDKLIWMDTSDSTTVTHFEILPYVDSYLKKQLFQDKSKYKRNYYGGRIFTEYYHTHFSIDDSTPYNQFYPLEDQYSGKIDLSWNIGLGDMVNAFSGSYKSAFYGRVINLLTPQYNEKYISPDAKKDIDILLKTSTNLPRETVAFHRKELVKQLKILTEEKKFISIIQGKRIDNKTFKDVMSRSKIFPSPFGWGEIGVRDYEAFIYGGALLKPSMTHMVTWPNIFIENETFVPFSWNYEDIEDKVCQLISNDNYRKRIATQGQRMFMNSISTSGQEKFCNHFYRLISD